MSKLYLRVGVHFCLMKKLIIAKFETVL